MAVNICVSACVRVYFVVFVLKLFYLSVKNSDCAYWIYCHQTCLYLEAIFKTIYFILILEGGIHPITFGKSLKVISLVTTCQLYFTVLSIYRLVVDLWVQFNCVLLSYSSVLSPKLISNVDCLLFLLNKETRTSFSLSTYASS